MSVPVPAPPNVGQPLYVKSYILPLVPASAPTAQGQAGGGSTGILDLGHGGIPIQGIKVENYSPYCVYIYSGGSTPSGQVGAATLQGVLFKTQAYHEEGDITNDAQLSYRVDYDTDGSAAPNISGEYIIVRIYSVPITPYSEPIITPQQIPGIPVTNTATAATNTITIAAVAGHRVTILSLDVTFGSATSAAVLNITDGVLNWNMLIDAFAGATIPVLFAPTLGSGLQFGIGLAVTISLPTLGAGIVSYISGTYIQ